MCGIEGSSLFVQSLSTILIFVSNKAIFINNKNFIFCTPKPHFKKIQAKLCGRVAASTATCGAAMPIGWRVSTAADHERISKSHPMDFTLVWV